MKLIKVDVQGFDQNYINLDAIVSMDIRGRH